MPAPSILSSLCRRLNIEHEGRTKTLAVEAVQRETVPGVGRVAVMLVTETMSSGTDGSSSSSSTLPRNVRIIEMVGWEESKC